MLTVLACIQRDHNPWLVLLAAIVCLTGCICTVKIMQRAREAAHRIDGTPVARAWIAGAGVSFGSAIWSTHFVAMLSYAPALGAELDPALTAFSLTVAVVGSLAALGGLLLYPNSHWRTVAAGLVMGAAIFAMHYTGMRALVMPAITEYDLTMVAASLVVGSLAAIAALFLATSRPGSCVAMLTLAVCGLHFTAMASLTILPFGAARATATPFLLAISVAAVCLLIVLLGLAGAIFDRHLDRRAEQEANRLRQFADSTFEGILFHRAGRITDINAALCRMTGRSAEVLIGSPVQTLFALASHGRIARALSAATKAAVEAVLLDSNGQEISTELLSRVDEHATDGYPAKGLAASASGVMVVRDLTDRKASERHIERLARYDMQTGVANRLLFREKLIAALERGRQDGTGVALLWIDLDRFKPVNDLLGHPVGDRLLAEVAARLVAAAAETDTIARVGGDEFAVVQPFAGKQDAAILANRLLSTIAETFEVHGHRISIGCSIGISLYPDDGEAPETLISNADLALYRAKQNGRCASCFFEGDMDRTRQERLLLEQDLRHALENGELHVHYQPQFTAGNLRLLGYEALIRWQHPARGAVSPVVFIPLAEACGLIVALGRWVLETACAEAASWREPHRIAVNLSPIQLRQEDLAQTVAAILRQTGLNPGRLELEVTEGVLINDPEHAMATLQAMKLQGIRIALDDYGTGYSSLSYLNSFPFDKIKIDASYVRNLGRDPTAEVILASVMGLGHGLDMVVTAEGVETEAQLATLRSHGCDQIQGFLLGRPMPKGELHHCTAGRMPILEAAD